MNKPTKPPTKSPANSANVLINRRTALLVRAGQISRNMINSFSDSLHFMREIYTLTWREVIWLEDFIDEVTSQSVLDSMPLSVSTTDGRDGICVSQITRLQPDTMNCWSMTMLTVVSRQWIVFSKQISSIVLGPFRSSLFNYCHHNMRCTTPTILSFQDISDPRNRLYAYLGLGVI